MYNRDQFAMAAMQGLIAAGWQTNAQNSWADLAKEAYRIADEMMAEKAFEMVTNNKQTK